MAAGNYAVVRYVPDPARDEPINIGILANGPAGAVFRTDGAALDRMRIVDQFLDAETVPYVQQYIEQLMREPVLRVTTANVETIAPWSAGFVDALRDQLPERFALGRTLFVEYIDESREAMEDAASDLAIRLVKPVTRKPVFPRDPGAPFEVLRRRLKSVIESGKVHVRPDVQGAYTRRVRQPDFSYQDHNGHLIVIATIKMTQRRRHDLSQTADARAFELFDLKQRPDVRTVAVVEQPEMPTPDFLDAFQSIKAVADEIVDPRDSLAALAERVEREAVPA